MCDKKAADPVYVHNRGRMYFFLQGLDGFVEKLVARGFSPDARNRAGFTAEELREQQVKEAEETAERHLAAKEERELRKRRQAEQEMNLSEVTRFCRNYGLADSVAEILYKKKFRYLDDAFFDLSSAMLKKFGLSNDDREKLEQSPLARNWNHALRQEKLKERKS
uniref:Ankyrin repeat protein n=1 Tax=Toxoplasma gondii TgCATBr9 TaxID=943120 RepID=A0A2T6IF08_TOXGO|nr:ankyrin repeat protein [Toxoplasma gondii TgCATBr9]